MSTDPQIWVIALTTLAVFSYLWKDNWAYRAVEHTFLGMSVAHAVVLTWDTAILPRVRTDIIGQGAWPFVIAGLLGLLMYTRLASPKWSWLSRYPVGLAVGYGVGFTMAMTPRPWVIQLRDSFRSLWVVRDGVFQAQATFNQWVFVIVLMTTLSYFFFTLSHQNRAVKGSAYLGRYAIMIGLGASFGNAVMGRISLFLGRLQFLLADWLGFGI